MMVSLSRMVRIRRRNCLLLDLILGIEQPVVITGAMRSSNEIGSDGLYNYISAIRVASDEKARHKGVMII